MDAAEDNNDVKLYRASGSLIEALERKLPRLIYKPPYDGPESKIRHYVLKRKYEEIDRVLDTFQEWPQLLDSKLPSFLSILNDGFLSYLSTSPHEYMPDRLHDALPLPRVICKLLYTFCKVRGQKVIVRFLSNEPRYLQPMIDAFRTWEAVVITNPTNGDGKPFVWEEKYVMLLWLSHLMLIPFDLTTASYGDAVASTDVQTNFSSSLPPVTLSILTLGIDNLSVPGKERETASLLLVRLALRPDMQKAGVLDGLVKLMLTRLATYEGDSTLPVYHLLGTLAVLSGLFNSGSDEDVAPFLRRCFQACHQAASGPSADSHAINSSANSRKLLIKILRSICLKAILLESRDSQRMHADQLSEILEEAIDYLLQALADKDTPIRFAASKALSMITLKLEPAMAAEIVEAVIGSLGEDLLYEMPGSGKLVLSTDLIPDQARILKPNMTAVDPMRWQGLMLTLAHLLYRRCPPTYQLPEILKSLLAGLLFEQRTPTGVSVGTGVRDAACFGLWSLSRKYSTSELMEVDMDPLRPLVASKDRHFPENVIQLVACQLVSSACLDPSGNIRRGSSAALQELVGRHPDTIAHGIQLVQTVDYHAIARRSRAVLEVAVAAAQLSPLYHASLMQELYGWQGIRSADAESRRIAASAVGVLCRLTTPHSVNSTIEYLVSCLRPLPSKARGSVLETRHGLLLALSAATRLPSETTQKLCLVGSDIDYEHLQGIVDSFHDQSLLFGEPLKRNAIRSELMFESLASIVIAICQCTQILTKELILSEPKVDFIIERLSLHLESENDIVIEKSTQAVRSLFSILDPDHHQKILLSWLDVRERSSRAFSSKGRISALGAIVNLLDGNLASGVNAQLQDFVLGPWPVEVRISALRSLADAQLDAGYKGTPSVDITAILRCGLSDYTTDQRGDIGSLARLEAIKYTKIAIEASPDLRVDQVFIQQVVSLVVRLAAEKLDKVRYQAWICLEAWWQNVAIDIPVTDLPTTRIASSPLQIPRLTHTFQHSAETSQPDYFLQLLSLFEVPYFSQPLLQGFISSASAGTETLLRSSRFALVSYILATRHPTATASHSPIEFDILQTLTSILSSTILDDRYAIPSLDILGFLLTQNLAGNTTSPSSAERQLYKQAFQLVQKAHFKTSSIPRLEASLYAYEGLALVSGGVGRDVRKKLAGMLVHPYPRVRSAVADALFVVCSVGGDGDGDGDANRKKKEVVGDVLRKLDWSVSPKGLKEDVERIKSIVVGGA